MRCQGTSSTNASGRQAAVRSRIVYSSLVSGPRVALYVGGRLLQLRDGPVDGAPAEAGSNRASPNTNQLRSRGNSNGLLICWESASEGLTQELVSGFRKRVLPGTLSQRWEQNTSWGSACASQRSEVRA